MLSLILLPFSSAELKSVPIEEETTCCLVELKPWSSGTAVMSADWIVFLVVAREREPVVITGEAGQSPVGLTMPAMDGAACNSVGIWVRAPATSALVLLLQTASVGVSLVVFIGEAGSSPAAPTTLPAVDGAACSSVGVCRSITLGVSGRSASSNCHVGPNAHKPAAPDNKKVVYVIGCELIEAGSTSWSAQGAARTGPAVSHSSVSCPVLAPTTGHTPSMAPMAPCAVPTTKARRMAIIIGSGVFVYFRVPASV
jgi:hypothetical protein